LLLYNFRKERESKGGKLMNKACVPFTLISLALITGCTHTAAVRPNIDVTATIANQLDFNVGLFIPPEVKGLEMTDRANWADKYIFKVGEAISSVIYKALARVFKNVELLESYPTEVIVAERNLDFVTTVRITEASAALSTQTGFFTVDATGNIQVSANLSFSDRKLIQFASIQATGTGMGNQEVDMLSTGKKEFSAPIEVAVRNLGNNIIQQVYGNYDIRKRAEEKK